MGDPEIPTPSKEPSWSSIFEIDITFEMLITTMT